MNSRLKVLLRNLLLGTAFGAVLCIGFFLWYYEIFPPIAVSKTASSWHDITVGQTALDEALVALGMSDSVEVRNDNQIYRYDNRQNLGWQRIELWIEQRSNQRVVFGILRDLPLENAEIQSLEQLVIMYGQPDKVTWANYCEARYLIWAHQGVAALASGGVRQFEWNELHVLNILIFKPMGVRQFLKSTWPWPQYGAGFANENTCVQPYTDAPDTLPEDPYDWEHMPTLSPIP